MIKSNKKIITAIALVLILALEGLFYFEPFGIGQEAEELPPLPELEYPLYISHAGGEINGVLSTNSFEAIEQTYNAGQKVIEVDFSFTSDRQIACIHDWNYGVLPGWENPDFPLTMEEFMSSSIYGQFTPMNAETLENFILEHYDTFIVFDAKYDSTELLTEIAESYPVLAMHMIPQIYSTSELDAVKALGYEHIIYTLYQLPDEDKLKADEIGIFARDNDIWAITFGYALCYFDGYLDALESYGVPLYTHTVNEAEEFAREQKRGITGTYTDNLYYGQ